MSARDRSVQIDLTQDLPPRSRPLSADATSKIFGGCLGEWTTCSQNVQCCSYKCRKMWWHSKEMYWEYQCMPVGAP